MEIDGADMVTAQVVHLVLHQRDKGRHYHRQAVEYESGYLERDGLAAARGHEAQCVAAGEDGPDYIGLQGTERVVAPVFLKDFLRLHSLKNMGVTGRCPRGACRVS